MNKTTTYDFFVSYRHREPDKSWVRKILVPALEASQLGAPLVTEMARAVEESRFTVAVITTAYIQSNFTELENVMAKQLGLENSQVRLIGVIRDPELDMNQVRLDIRGSLMLDMTDDDEFDILIERLVGAVKNTD